MLHIVLWGFADEIILLRSWVCACCGTGCLFLILIFLRWCFWCSTSIKRGIWCAI